MDINLAICHNGSRAPGKHTQYFISSNFCDDCYSTVTRSNARFDHKNLTAVSSRFDNGLTPTLCAHCHSTNKQTMAWPFSVYKSDCAGCHTNDYKSDSHKGSGNALLPINEVQDFSGHCHLKDGIKSNEHRASAGDW